MKNFNIMGGGGGHKNQYIGGNCLKRGMKKKGG